MLACQFLLDALERQADIAFDDAFGTFVTGERPADEIVHAGVTDVLADGRIDIAETDKTAGQSLRADRGCEPNRCQQEGSKPLQNPHGESVVSNGGDFAAGLFTLVPATLVPTDPGDNSECPSSRLPPVPSLPIALVFITPPSQ